MNDEPIKQMDQEVSDIAASGEASSSSKPPLLSSEVVQLYQHYVMPNYVPNRVMVKGRGVYLWDADGNRYLDFLAGIAVNTLGHSHPILKKAIKKQVSKLLHVSNLYYTEPQARLAKKLTTLSLGGKCFFCNSGAEANEALIKLARLWGNPQGKYEVITLKNSFHGRTMQTLTATGQEKIQRGFEPLPAGFSYGEMNHVETIAHLISDKTAAVLVEPIQGEGGVIPAQLDFLRALRELCTDKGILLFCDEIQSGIGRTGKWFGYEHAGITPDAISLAKGLGGGLPIGAIVTTPALADIFQPGTHGSTFGGNPVSCAAALAVLDVIEKEGLLPRVEAMGEKLEKGLKKQQDKHPFIKDIRGKGLMLGVVMDRPCKEFQDILARKGLLCLATAENVVRMLPPLTVRGKHVRQAVKLFGKACEEWRVYMELA